MTTSTRADEVWRTLPQESDVASVRERVTESGVFSAEEIEVAVELVAETLDRGAASDYEFFFVDRNDVLVGYTCYGRIPGTVGSWDLYWIAVARSEQQRGLGRALLARTERSVREAGGDRIFLDTSSRADYAPAHGLYRAAGFRQMALLEDFYAPNDSKLIFGKSLSGGGQTAPR